MDNDGLTQYMRIAISVAERIAAGELREGEKNLRSVQALIGIRGVAGDCPAGHPASQ